MIEIKKKLLSSRKDLLDNAYCEAVNAPVCASNVPFITALGELPESNCF